MYTQVVRRKMNKTRSAEETVAHRQRNSGSPLHIMDKAPKANEQWMRKVEPNNTKAAKLRPTVQRRAATTDLPDRLKSGIEESPRLEMDCVKGYYNSDREPQLQRKLYTIGGKTSIAPGRYKNLPHEALLAAHQKERSAEPAMHLKGKKM